MRANELMIDDWVLIEEPDKYAGAKAQIKTLIYHKEDDGQYFNVFVRDKLGIVRREVFNEDLRPIPLTAEILEKNGFEMVLDKYKLPTYRVKCTCNPDLHFTVFTGVDGYWNPVGFNVILGGIPATVDYVHQLQHALRLCGINKEITL